MTADKIEIISSPRPDDERHWFERNPPMDFIECDTCQALSGAPTLCHGCVNNRTLISNLKKGLLEDHNRLDGGDAAKQKRIKELESRVTELEKEIAAIPSGIGSI